MHPQQLSASQNNINSTNHDCDQAIETRAFQIMDISKASSLGDVGEVEGGLEITLDLSAMKVELTRVQAKCAIRGLAQVQESTAIRFILTV